jgi:hypothetical protein
MRKYAHDRYLHISMEDVLGVDVVQRGADASHDERQLWLRKDDALLDVIAQVRAREEVHDEVAAGATIRCESFSLIKISY